MSEQTSKSGPGLDEERKHETPRLVQEGLAEVAEDERRGTPPGMTPAEVDLRSDIAQVLGISAFPADRDGLLDVAGSHQAPDAVLDRLRTLPAGEQFRNVQDVARALGLHVETTRT